MYTNVNNMGLHLNVIAIHVKYLINQMYLIFCDTDDTVKPRNRSIAFGMSFVELLSWPVFDQNQLF